jgi:riboflavin kinase/FMN adenylyltransferase
LIRADPFIRVHLCPRIMLLLPHDNLMSIYTVEWNAPVDLPCQGGALTIGNFDGVHRGHQALLAELRRQAELVQGAAIVLTFDPHPLQLLRPQKFPPLLTTMRQRAELLSRHGADFVLILHATQEMLQVSARDFFDQVIRDNLQPRVVVPGFNFFFGHNREGTVETLREFCREAGFGFDLVPPAEQEGQIISSSRIRQVLRDGAVRRAAELLGRPYVLSGVVGTGQRRGQKLGFPTANLEDLQTLVPADGVYAVRAVIAERPWPGAANIGPNPTFGEDARKVEVHLIDFEGDLYGRTLAVEFLERLRDTRAFAGPDELVRQLRHDVADARRLATAEPP